MNCNGLIFAIRIYAINNVRMVRFLIFPFLLAMHPVHVSLLSIDFSAEREVFDMFVKVYFDDFLIDAGIDSNSQNMLKFSDADQYTKKIVTGYINDKIKIVINDKQIPARFENVNLSDNELRINLLLNFVGDVKTIMVKNLIMTSIYSDQANMTIVKVNDFEEGIKFTPEETEKTFIIN